MTARCASPLRYPGGKSCLYDAVAKILRINRLEKGHYAEPYAGGAGLALLLLFNGHVSEVHLNDVDRSIWAFWNCILNDTDHFVRRLEDTPVDLDQWRLQKKIHENQDNFCDLDVAFATFFLNRTNRSGIVKGAGMIGGYNQLGAYKIDCRFNKEDLVKRIRRIAKYKSRIHLYGIDALKFVGEMEAHLPNRSFMCIDPPYFNKGSSLYTSFYNEQDHLAVSQAILQLEKAWILTYDNTPEIAHLYRQRRQFNFDVNYSLQTKRIGSELLVASKGLKLPAEIRDNLFHRPQHRA